jgi:hypothetical protein
VYDARTYGRRFFPPPGSMPRYTEAYYNDFLCSHPGKLPPAALKDPDYCTGPNLRQMTEAFAAVVAGKDSNSSSAQSARRGPPLSGETPHRRRRHLHRGTSQKRRRDRSGTTEEEEREGGGSGKEEEAPGEGGAE